jgi:hypothetical protein
MSYNPDIHHRRSIRLRNDDYSLAGNACSVILLTRPACRRKINLQFLQSTANMMTEKTMGFG